MWWRNLNKVKEQLSGILQGAGKNIPVDLFIKHSEIFISFIFFFTSCVTVYGSHNYHFYFSFYYFRGGFTEFLSAYLRLPRTRFWGFFQTAAIRTNLHLIKHPGIQSGSILWGEVLHRGRISVSVHMISTRSYNEHGIRQTCCIYYSISMEVQVVHLLFTFSKHGQDVRTAPTPCVPAFIKHGVKFHWILFPACTPTHTQTRTHYITG